MVDPRQCPAHTRTPWGSNPHHCSPRLRNLMMGILTLFFIAVIVLTITFIVIHQKEQPSQYSYFRPLGRSRGSVDNYVPRDLNNNGTGNRLKNANIREKIEESSSEEYDQLVEEYLGPEYVQFPNGTYLDQFPDDFKRHVTETTLHGPSKSHGEGLALPVESELEIEHDLETGVHHEAGSVSIGGQMNLLSIPSCFLVPAVVSVGLALT